MNMLFHCTNPTAKCQNAHTIGVVKPLHANHEKLAVVGKDLPDPLQQFLVILRANIQIFSPKLCHF